MWKTKTIELSKPLVDGGKDIVKIMTEKSEQRV